MKRRPFFIFTFIALMIVFGSSTVAIAQNASPAAPAATQSPKPMVEYNIPYGEDNPRRQKLTVYRLESREKPRPAIVLIHGGSFVEGDPNDMAFVSNDFVSAGFVTFLVGYRLFDEQTGENPFPTALDDVQLAVRWVRAHATEFNVDPDRIGAVGVSTGGQLAGLLGTTDTRDPSKAPLAEYSSRVNAVASISGDLDLTLRFDALTAALYAGIMGGSQQDHPELYVAASPVHHVDRDTVPFLITHGTADPGYLQSRNMVQALMEASIEFVHTEFPGLDHPGAIFQEKTWMLVGTFMVYQLHPEE